MQRVSTTVIALVGEDAGECAALLGAAANVRAVTPDDADPPLDRAVHAWREAVKAHIPFLVHDADPLAAVADAWVRWYDQQGVAGDLEVAVSDALARWRARALELPDYYLVLDAESLPPTQRHWYLGFLHRSAPHRVVPAAAQADDIARRVASLRAGRWWPDLDRLLDGLDRVVPDRL
ncbi:MAG: hypothetical protein ACRDU8_10415 [Egibacteraceae bacterium]